MSARGGKMRRMESALWSVVSRDARPGEHGEEEEEEEAWVSK